MTDIGQGTKEVFEMAQPALEIGRVRKGEDLLDFICEELSIKPTMVAALLSVTERTLSNWKSKSVDDAFSTKMMRLIALHTVVSVALSKGVRPEVMLSFLNEPLNDSGMSLLGYIVDDPDNSLLEYTAEGLAQGYHP